MKTKIYYYIPLLLSLIFICAGHISYSQIKADFSADNTTGCAPAVVKFKDLSTGNPTSWKWDLGNGTVSFLQNPSATYFAPGAYSIKLVVQNDNGADTIIKEKLITVNSLPTINFQASQITGCYPLPLQFADGSTSNSGSINSWEWDFGDGNLSNLQNPSHTYTSGGNFNVTLRVINSSGCSKTLTKNNYIQIGSGVKASFINDTPKVCAPPAIVHFTNTSNGSGNLSYKWDFGDSSTSTQVNPVHSYNSKGLYTVTLIVNSSIGCTDTIIKVGAIDLRTVAADFSFPALNCPGSTITFINTSVPSPKSSSWYFSDGTSSFNINSQKQYDSAGTYNVKLVSAFESCSDSITKKIIIKPKPQADFKSDNYISCKVPIKVNFTSLSKNGVKYLWDFGDGDTSSQKNPAHTYQKLGGYKVTLIVYNQAGCADTMVRNDFINLTPPSIAINDVPIKGCLPLSNTFKSNINSSDSVINYNWDFGDGSTSQKITPTHTYNKAGTFTLKLWINTLNGCTDTLVVPAAITAGYKLLADFAADKRVVCAFTDINFYDSTKPIASDTLGKPDKWLWNFGDKGNSTDQNPIHHYNDTGNFSVNLIAYNLGCADTTTFENYIHINAPVSRFEFSYDCSDRYTRKFIDKSAGADAWTWDFGDGSFSSLQNPTHKFSAPGTYAVKLRTTNKNTSCDNILKKDVQIIDEKAAFDADQTVICKSLAVNFLTSKMNFINLTNILWDFGDNTVASANRTDISHTYNKAGIYDVKLIANDILGCSDTFLKPTLITVNSPIANFSNPVFSCASDAVIFTDSSKNDGSHAIKTWEWNFGEPNQSVQAYPSGPFLHKYSSSGNFDISLKVTDINGCFDILTKSQSLHISKATANFEVLQLSCSGSPITFNNKSTDSIQYNNWNFGDGTSSSDASPLHQYGQQGNYNIQLKVTDNFGCRDSISKNNFIVIADPKASFKMSDSVSNCPPLVVNFTNTSLNCIQYSWDFGDGNVSNLKDPSHFYSTAGTYIVTLTATAVGGCIDSFKNKIIIKGPSGNFTYNTFHGCAPLVTSFNANVKNTASIIWDFNDGTTRRTTAPSTNHIYSVSGSFIPKTILMDDAGCKVPLTGIDTINVYDVRANFSFQKIQYCDSVKFNFQDSSVSNDFITDYTWSFESSSGSTDQNPSHTFTKDSNYNVVLKVQTLEGCSSISSQIIQSGLVTKPKISIDAVAQSCAKVLVDFNGIINNPNAYPVQWSWSFGNGQTAIIKHPVPQQFTTNGNNLIRLIASKEGGCNDTVFTNIFIHPLPVVSIEGKTNVCKGDIQNLIIQGADQYSWSPAKDLSCNNCSAPSYKADQNITYVVSGTTTFGCTDKDSISIKVMQPFVMTAGGIDSICVGKSVQLSASGAVSYSWYPSTGLSNPNIASPVATPTVTTNYRVVGSNNETCFKDTSFVMVTVFPIPVVSAGADKNINAGGTAILTPKISADVINVHWTPTLGIVGSSYPSVTVKPSQTTEYSIEAVNSGGCRSRDKMTVFVLCNDANVFIPNTFSPNGDGANDIFYPRGSGLFSIKSFRIFDRRGELVYQTNDMKANDPSKGWDGKFKGSKLAADVFIYVVEIVCDNNQILTYKGNITLLQ